jgi:hypothetical protein
MNGARNLKLHLFLYEMIGGEEHQRMCWTCLMPIAITLWLANEVLSLLAKKTYMRWWLVLK